MLTMKKARRQYGSASGDDVPIIGLPMWNEIRLTRYRNFYNYQLTFI